jgi:hypothetical protein
MDYGICILEVKLLHTHLASPVPPEEDVMQVFIFLTLARI